MLLDFYCAKFSECSTILATWSSYFFKMRIVKSGYFFVALLWSLCANGAHARDRYQRMEDHKTLFWNNFPKAGNVATWSGGRDKDRYATGHGTLTWYRTDRTLLTGFNIPFTKHAEVSRYSGKMVHGKFDGMVVSVDANKKTFHAAFVEGRKTGKWAAGPAPTPAPAAVAAADQQRDEQVQRAIAVETEPEPPAPGAGPTTVAAATDSATKPAHRDVAARAIKATPSPVIDDSLKSIISPPSLLRMSRAANATPQPSIPPITSSPPPARPHLTQAEAIALADAEARAQDYDLGEYQRPQADYTAADGTWSVSYDQKNADGSGKHFSVSVEDKTKKAAVKN